jgi:hypothetical protein
MATLEQAVCDGSENKLLAQLEKRSRLLNRHEAAHPMTVERVLAALDAIGPSEAGDVIQSLLWAKVKSDHLAAALSDQMAEIDRHEHRSDVQDDALERIKQWAEAYPVEVFPEMSNEDWKRADEVLAAAGLSLTQISASNMRHVITKTKQIVAEGLAA